jgi:DMSO/TMAO reductase YedYZ molybdopterin-dependent catalytic subunit
LIIRETDPLNLESPAAILERFITPNELFYVRNHFPPVEAAPGNWRLRVEGAIDQPFDIEIDELMSLPSRTVLATLECAGNGRALLTPAANGVQWERGAVGTAHWTGLPLGVLLQRARLRAEAVEVILEGADCGEVTEEPKSPGPLRFARSVPLAGGASSGADVLLAYRMNGEPLPGRHGFPLRAVVPGWYGMASVKWLHRIVVTDRAFHGYFQTFEYGRWHDVAGLPTLAPLARMEVKAEFARPAAGEIVPRGATYRVSGAAWAGESAVAKVEVSEDGGETWASARLLDDSLRNVWRRWDYEWRIPAAPGARTLMARATDSEGRTQPVQRNPDLRTYAISHVISVSVEVR